MCGRFTLLVSVDTLATLFDLADMPDLTPRYNIAPTQEVAAVRRLDDITARECLLLHWGLVPSWAADTRGGGKLINARAETVAEKPVFRSAFRRRRCLVLADGFYEWETRGREKQPYYFQLGDHRPYAFAGLWETWQAVGEAPYLSCTLLTTSANSLLQRFHDRMPVILPPAAYDQWLDPEVQEPERLLPLLQPYPADQMTARPVSVRVNSVRHDDPACLAPAEVQRDLPFG